MKIELTPDDKRVILKALRKGYIETDELSGRLKKRELWVDLMIAADN